MSIASRLNIFVFTFLVINLFGCGASTDPEQQLQQARLAIENHDYKAAAIAYLNVLHTRPDDADTRMKLGDLYIRQRQGYDAESQFKKAKAAKPELDIRSQLGRALILQGAYDRLREEVDVTDEDSTEQRAQIINLRAYSYALQNRAEEAAPLFNEVLETQPENPDALTGLALSRLKQNDLLQSLELADKAIQLDKEHVDAYLVKGRALVSQKQLDQAAETLQKSITSADDEFSFFQPDTRYYYFIQVLIDLGKINQAQEEISHMETAFKGSPLVHYLKALLAYETDDIEKAGEEINIVRARAPDFSPAMVLQGAINYSQGNFEQGSQALTAYLEEHPDSNTAKKLLAATRLKQKQPENAYSLVSPLLSQDPGNLELMMLASEAMRNSGNPKATIDLLTRLLEKDPDNNSVKLELASAYLADKNYDKGLSILEALPESENGFGRREISIMLALSKTGRYQQALDFTDRYLEKHPDDANVWANRGVVYLKMDDIDHAREQLEKSLAIKPDNEMAIMTLSHLEYRAKNYTRTKKLIEQLLSLQPDNASYMYALANVEAILGNKQASINMLEKSRAASSEILQPRLILVKYYLETNSLDKALQVATEATDIAPVRADVWNTLSVVQTKSGDFKGAIQSLKKAALLDTKSDTVLYNLAKVQVRANKAEDAVSTLEKLLKLKPDHFHGASMLALIDMQQGKTADAMAIAKQQQAFADNRFDAYSLEGDLHVLTGAFQDALKAYQSAYDINKTSSLTVKIYRAAMKGGQAHPETVLKKWLSDHPDDEVVRNLLASHYQNAGQNELAAREYEKILQSSSNDAGILNNLANVYYELDDKRALETAEKAYKIDSSNPAIKDTLGWILVNDTETARGLKLLGEAKTGIPGNREIQYHYAVGLVKSGDKEKARTLLQSMTESNFDFKYKEEASKLLNSL